jgi:hypothetical protein
MEIKDNTFRRQFETTVEEGIGFQFRYSFQEKKIFLTKSILPINLTMKFISQLLSDIMAIAIERKLK